MRPRIRRLSPLVVMLALLVATPSVQFAAAQGESSQTAEQGERPKDDATGYPSLTWRFETESQITDTPVLAGDTLLVQSEDGYLYALDEVTGERRWRVETGHGPFLRAEFAVSGETVFVADTMGKLLAVDVASGDELWSRSVAESEENQIFSPPTVLDGVVYVDDIEGDFGNVYALDAESGDPIWQAKVGRMPAYALPVADGTVVVSDIDGAVWFLDAQTGELRATHDTGKPLGFPPTVAEGVAYVGVAAGRIDALELDTAQVRWSIELPVASEMPPSVWGIAGDVLIASIEDRLIGIGTEDGAIRWEVATLSYTSPTIDGEQVYVLDPESRLTALDAASGDPLWSSGRQVRHLAVTDRLLYANVGQSVYALDRATGAELWRVRTGGLVHAPALVSGGTMYVGSGDHSLYALDLQSRTDIRDGFADLPPAVKDDPLLTIRIDSLPDAPAFAGIWRATLQAGEKATLPPFAGPAAAVVRGGSLSSPDGFLVGSTVEITTEAETVEEGESLFLPVGEPLPIENAGNTTVELLIVGILPTGADLPVAERGEAEFELLGGDAVQLLPGDGAFVELHRSTLDPGATLLPTLSVWPDLLVVEDGSIEVAAAGGADVTTYEASDSVATEVGVTRFVQAGDAEPATLLVMEIDGDIHIGQGAGCGGRCLSPR